MPKKKAAATKQEEKEKAVATKQEEKEKVAAATTPTKKAAPTKKKAAAPAPEPPRRSLRDRRGVGPDRFSPTAQRTKSLRSRAREEEEDKTKTKRAAATKKKKKAADTKKKSAPAKKRKREEEPEAESEEEDKKKTKGKRGGSSKPAAKKQKKATLSDEQEQALSSMKADDLKQRLRDNDQVITGPKQELLDRIRDCVANGCLPRCPKCFGGRLKKRGKGYYCPGSYDDDTFVRCSYTSNDCERVPWKNADGQCI